MKIIRNNRKISGFIICISLVCMLQTSCAQKSTTSPIVHDPVLIKQADTYYVFCTGPGITSFTSTDLVNWTQQKPIFKEIPQWVYDMVPEFNGHMWAPDIYLHEGTYYLYYSVSAFAKNTSFIGLVTNKTLDASSPDYKWEEKGVILQSIPGRDLWNAIDPNIIADENGDVWMSFGSFWSGIKAVKLSPDLTSLENNPQEWYSLSSRPRSYNIPDKNPGDAALEAPFIFKKGKYYYLFVSFDHCCRGKDSDYKVVVGRSEKLTGPYFDKEGNRMDQGGGSLVIEGNHNWYGVGHNSAYTIDGKDLFVFHGYDASDNALPKLLIRDMNWDTEGWPVVKLEEK